MQLGSNNGKINLVIFLNYKIGIKAIFQSRPNRFIAHCLVDGKETVCHVKNTGRCKELLLPGCTLYLCPGENPARKTPYDVIGVEQNGQIINIDSMAPNRAVAEWLPSFLPKGAAIRPETKFGDSRIDFYAKAGEEEFLIEVKGVTLKRNGVALFPDAPTTRGVKHLKELTKAARQGYRCYVIFVIQMQGVSYFAPNDQTDPAFAEALRQADAAGVHILAMDCTVTPTQMELNREIPVRLK